MVEPNAIERILERARWAPSGDNTQPWRFELLRDDHVAIHAFDTRDHCVYDINGRPSQIAVGALLETLQIAASTEGLKADIERRADAPETQPVFDVRLVPDSTVQPSVLAPHIEERSVHRRSMSTQALNPDQKRNLEAAVGGDYRVVWLEDFASRFAVARLLYRFAKLRLTMPEAYFVHRSVIAWNSRYSEDKVPDQAIGLDPMTLGLMRWVMQSWQRVSFFNKYLAGSILPRLELDLVPGLACAAHFIIVAARPAQTIDDYVAAGRAVQRFWLSATRLGLALQPEMTPLIFTAYVRGGQRFSKVEDLWPLACRLADALDRLCGEQITQRAVFLGRVGYAKPYPSRSLRRALAALKTSAP